MTIPDPQDNKYAATIGFFDGVHLGHRSILSLMNSIKKEQGLKTIAFPLISAGVYGYPQREAIKVAVETMKLHKDDFDEITLVLFGDREFGYAGEEYPEFLNS